MKKHLYTVWGVLAMALLLPSCKDGYYDNTPDEPLRVSVDTIRVGKETRKVTIGVVARDAGWTMTGNKDWCTVNPASGDVGITQVSVAFAANDQEDAQIRTATFTFTSGGVEKTVAIEQSNQSIEPEKHPDAPINEAILKELQKWYYNGEPAQGAPADVNQSFDDFYFNYLSHLGRNEHDGNYWSTGNTRYLYSYIDTVRTSLKNTAPLNYGMEFELTTGFNGKMTARILYVEPGSPAARAGLVRGDWFYKVNDVPLADGAVNDDLVYPYYYNRLIDSLVHPVAGKPQKLGMQTFRATPPQELLDEGRAVTLTPENFSGNPIFHTATYGINRLAAVGGGTENVGYMMYNSFDPAYRNELIQEFAGFKDDDLDSFILDLRYNKNGTVEMAELLGNLLVGGVPDVAGKTFAEYVFDKASPMAGGKVPFKAEANSIVAEKMTVFVLTSPHTAGASELLINALRGLDQSVVKLVVIGSVTQGMAAGMVKRTYVPEGGDLEYSAWILAFRCYNERGRNTQGGDYIYGFAPNGGMVSEWDRANNGENLKWSTTWGWKGNLGSTEDPLVRRAVDMVAGREVIPTGNVVNASQRQRAGYPREFAFPTNMTMEEK